MEKKKGFHYAWLILIGCCCFNAGSIALSLNVAGIFMLPLQNALSLAPQEVALWISFLGPCSIVAGPVWGYLIQNKNINIVVTIASLFMIAAFIIFALASSAWMLYLAGAFVGISIPCTYTLVSAVLVGNWFDASIRGRILGIVTTFTGIGTFVWAPLFTVLIQNLGLQMTYVVVAILCAVLLLPFSLFVFKLKPEEKGLLPFGYKPGADNKLAKPVEYGAKLPTAVKTIAFWAVMIAFSFTIFGMGFNTTQPAFAREFLVGLMEQNELALFGASMISVAAAANIVGKIIFGFMIDKLGLKPTFILFYLLLICSFIIWLAIHNPAGMMVGAFIFGTHNALVAVGFPLMARSLFGSKNFSKIYAYISGCGQFIGNFGPAVIAYIYVLFGSYMYALYFGVGLMAIMAILVIIALSRVGKIAFDDVDDEQAPILESAQTSESA